VSISGHSPEGLYLIINNLQFWHWICVFPSERTKQNSHLANTEQKNGKIRDTKQKKDRKAREKTGKSENKPEDPKKQASRKPEKTGKPETRTIKIKQQAI